jgi:serine/threonine-protein kinase
MILVYIPVGEFLMGSDESTIPEDRPAHSVYLDAFWIDQTEVTNAMFSKFVTDIGYRTDAEQAGKAFVDINSNWIEVEGADWQHPQGPESNIEDLENHPVVQVSWNDAKAYCEWAGRRLPTEAEWEKAARGTDGRTYPWGEGIDCNRANYLDCVGRTSEVGSYPDGASPYGALDMAGNVWEWVSDWNDETYYQNSPPRNPQGPDSGFTRGMRGGSWEIFSFFVKTYARYSNMPDSASDFVGFRCAISP